MKRLLSSCERTSWNGCRGQQEVRGFGHEMLTRFGFGQRMRKCSAQLYGGAIFRPRHKLSNFHNAIMSLRAFPEISPFVQKVKDWPGTSDVDNVFGVMKNIFGFRKTRYRGMAKNLRRLEVTAALTNI